MKCVYSRYTLFEDSIIDDIFPPDWKTCLTTFQNMFALSMKHVYSINETRLHIFKDIFEQCFNNV